MPIKDPTVYPGDWPAIRAEILERAGNRCEWCGLANRVRGVRDQWGDFMCDAEPDYRLLVAAGRRPFRIVLTVAHLDHDTRNNGVPGARPNLAALCQKCHLGHDAKHHARNARRTRWARKATGDLFDARQET